MELSSLPTLLYSPSIELCHRNTSRPHICQYLLRHMYQTPCAASTARGLATAKRSATEQPSVRNAARRVIMTPSAERVLTAATVLDHIRHSLGSVRSGSDSGQYRRSDLNVASPFLRQDRYTNVRRNHLNVLAFRMLLSVNKSTQWQLKLTSHGLLIVRHRPL